MATLSIDTGVVLRQEREHNRWPFNGVPRLTWIRGNGREKEEGLGAWAENNSVSVCSKTK